MKLTLLYPYDKRLIDLFAPEDRNIGRASYTMQQQDDDMKFIITADDATAMRTLTNSILKLLQLWEKSENL